MRGLYWQALGIAGLFTLMPGRAINRALFPATPDAGWIVIAAGGAGLLAVWLRGRRRAQA
jgi:hypothetical protein